MTMTSTKLVRDTLTSVLDGTFRSGVTWAKVISMVTISAAFAEECVVQGHAEFVEEIVSCVGQYTSARLKEWIAVKGGWVSIVDILLSLSLVFSFNRFL